MKAKKLLCSILAFALILSTMGFTVLAEDTDIIEVGTGKAYETWSAAVAAATDEDGNKTITYHIYGKVEVDSTAVWASPRGASGATTINFVGMTDDAEISITASRQIIATDAVADMVAINYTDLILSRPNGSWTDDLAHANQFFTTWMRGAADGVVTYTDCTFLNGTCANTYNETVYTNCNFKNETSNALWIMGGDVEVVGGTVEAAKGIKTYNDNPATVINADISGVAFDVELTPAVIASAIGNVTLEDIDTTACEYGVIENGVAGGAIATVTIDGENPSYVATTTNKYGVTIYTTDMEYAEAVTEEAVANGRVDAEVADIVAEVNGSYYTSLHAAISAAQSGDVVEVLKSETYAVWNAISGKDGITINGNGNTITVTDSVYSNGNGGALLRNASNLTINDLNVDLPATPTPEMERLAIMKSGTLNNVTVTGGTFAVSIVDEGVVEISNCTFEDIGGWAIETEGKAANASLTISNSTFDEAAVILRGGNNTFTDNTITGAGEGVNVLGDAVISGNDFGESTLGIDRGVEVVVEKNIINNVEFSEWLAGDYSEVTVENNTLSDEAVAEMNDKLDTEVVSVDPVAEVNGKKYYSLVEAVAELEEGDTLKIASGRYDGFDILVDNVTITGMTADAEITINSIPGNAFIGINAEGVLVEGLKFIIPEDCVQTGDWLDGFDAVIGYWSNNFNAGSNVTTGYDVENCHFVNEHPGIGVAMFNFNSFEITGNVFENFNVGIHTMSDGSAMGDVVISANTFTSVNEPVNVYWGQTGSDDDSIAITGNNFVSAKDADEIKITVHDYASTVTGTSGIDAIDISGNTYSAETEVVLVDAASDVSSSVENALENVENVVVDTKYVAVARIGADKYFTSIEAAIGAAVAGDNEIVILPGVYDISFMVNQTEGVNITITAENKGDVTLTGTISVNGNRRQNGAETLTISNIVFDGSEKTAAHNFIIDSNGTPNYPTYAHNVTVTNCDFIGNGDFDNAVVAFREPKAGSNNIVFDNVTANGLHSLIQVSNSKKITVTNSTISNGESVVNATGSAEVVFTNNTVDVENFAVRTGQSSASTNTVSSITMNNNTIVAGVTALVLRNATTTAVVTNNRINAPTVHTAENSDSSTINGVAVTAEDIEEEIDKDNAVNEPLAPIAPVGGSGGVARYTVVFVTNGGTSVDKISNLKNRTVDLAEYTTEKEGYTFEGWYTDKELTNKVTSVKLTDDITLYAKWVEIANEPGTTEGGNLFADVKTADWFYENVKYVVENELMNGVDEDKFAPNDTLTRAMLVTVLYRLDGEPVVENASFTDVDADAYYANAVSWAKQNGIVNGVTENEFAPNSDITREQIAAILHRYAQYKGYDVSVGENTNILSYADAESVSEYAASSMQYAVGSGLIKGKSATTLNPLDNATRAEIAAILQRFIEANNN